MPDRDITYRNRLLGLLAPDDLARLGCGAIDDIAGRTTLETRGEVLDRVVFIEDGFASVVCEDADGGPVEIGLIGCEGMTGISVVLGGKTTPFQAYMHNPGRGVYVEAAALRNAMADSDTLRALLNRYTLAYSIQIASTATANARGSIEERLARWLLMVSDRVGPRFAITHEFLAQMLAVQRPGVTLALQSLEGKGLIQSTRGNVTIAAREGLVAHTAGIYGMAEREYETLMG